MSSKEKVSKSDAKGQRSLERSVLEGINNIFLQALTGNDEEELAKLCLHTLEKITNSDYGFIGEINPVGRFDTIAVSNPGWDACGIDSSKAGLLITDMDISGIWGKVLKDGKSLLTNAPSKHPSSSGLPPEHPPLNAFLGVPMKQGELTIGMISLAKKKGRFTKKDQEAVESLAVAVNQALHSKQTENKLAAQAQEILELSTPVLKIWEGIVIAPLIGSLDSERTRQFMDLILSSIETTNSSVALIDITGVPILDTQTAQHIIDTIGASRLLGAEVILTGVRPEIAKTLVHLGIDLSEVITRASLSAGIRVGLKRLGLEVQSIQSQ
ncbi:GAF domain-containing protein [Pseudodesulfovibrio sp. zrk46]|uniref:GAF domain-containing protein n=1 Tax=Pseudodesulfovibrio sp. zrk46 TaxID=2725288 RepID=UPI0014491A69|nr:GAF domain-containing protein [Pseudodesulfovibrio sp. zrk46]QJB57175.1 GAF domain-containing protein [Pseudodesulfovibrio sp. zrk46]